MDERTEVAIKLPLGVWRTVHALAFKAPSTGAECVMPLSLFHQALLAAAADPPPAPAPQKAKTRKVPAVAAKAD